MVSFVTSHFKKSVLAEFEQDLFKHQHWARAPQNGEGLPSKQGVGYSSQRGTKQGLNCTLEELKEHNFTELKYRHSNSVWGEFDLLWNFLFNKKKKYVT